MRHGARGLIEKAVETELQFFLSHYENVTDLHGRKTVVRNGYLLEREVLIGLGSITVKVPKVRDRSGTGVKFNSAIVPPYVRKAKRVEREVLLSFYDFPAEHWAHIRTANPIESTFATIRHRTTRTKNCVSRNTLLGLVFQLALSAERSWLKLRGFDRLPEVIKGIKFQDGIAVLDVANDIEYKQQNVASDSN